MSHAGEKGMRNYVHKDLHNQIVDELKAKIKKLDDELIRRSDVDVTGTWIAAIGAPADG